MVPRAWSAGAALLALAVYLALAPPVTGDKDSAELTLVLALAGVAHPTGYPLFTLLGHAWVTLLHALGVGWAYAANSWTALGGAVAIYFLERLALAFMKPVALERGAAFALSALPAAWLAFNPIWTYETTIVEVYAWHVAWALGLAVFFVGLARRIESGAASSLRDAALWGLLCGIGAAHHATSVFVVLPLSVALLTLLARRRRLPPDHVAAALALALLPVLTYGFVLWHASHPAPIQWPWLRPGLDGLLEHVTGRQYVGRLGTFTPSAEQSKLLRAYVWPFLFPGLALLVYHAVRSRELAVRALALAALLGTVYAFSYGVPDPASYFLYPMAFGLAALAPMLATGFGRSLRWFAFGLLVMLSIGWLRLGAARSAEFVRFDRYVASMWRAIPHERALVFWTDDMHYKLEARQRLDHEKPGIEILSADVLRNQEPRRQFALRHGFDPMPASTHMPDQASGMEDYVNRMSPLPVIHFDPARGEVRLLKKP